MPTATVIVPAAGRGRRFVSPGGLLPGAGPSKRATKAFAPLAGRPVLAHTLARFARVEGVVEVVVPVPAEAVAWAGQMLADAVGPGRRLLFIAGGRERLESVAKALAASDANAELVVIHDAVRPLIRRRVIEEAMRVAAAHGAAVVGRPVDHTVKKVSGERRVAETVPREGLWLAQTPQVFRREIVTRAYQRAEGAVGGVTDDAQLVEAIGHRVVMVHGDAANVKITTLEDLRLCEALLAAGWPFGDEG